MTWIRQQDVAPELSLLRVRDLQFVAESSGVVSNYEVRLSGRIRQWNADKELILRPFREVARLFAVRKDPDKLVELNGITVVVVLGLCSFVVPDDKLL